MKYIFVGLFLFVGCAGRSAPRHYNGETMVEEFNGEVKWLKVWHNGEWYVIGVQIA